MSHQQHTIKLPDGTEWIVIYPAGKRLKKAVYQANAHNVVVHYYEPHDMQVDIADAGMGDAKVFIVASAIIPGLG